MNKFALLILLIVIIGSAFLVSGLAPHFSPTPSNGGEYQMVTPGQSGGNNSLQLSTIKFKKCSSTTAVDFLLDRSSSMTIAVAGGGTKISRLKEAVLTFVGSFSDSSVVGIQDYSSAMNPRGPVAVLVPFSYYKDVKTNLPALVNQMQAIGNTWTRDAFVFSFARMQEAIPKFPNYKMAFIFISDGQPNTIDHPNPLQTQNPTDIAVQIKNAGIKIFTISYGADADVNLMRSLASSPAEAYVAPTTGEINGILTKIANKLCE